MATLDGIKEKGWVCNRVSSVTGDGGWKPAHFAIFDSNRERITGPDEYPGTEDEAWEEAGFWLEVCRGFCEIGEG